MIYRMLALNIDGSVVNENGKIAKETRDAIEYVQNKEVQVTLVTSRNFASARKVAKALKIDGPIITHGGSYIAHERDQPIFVKKIPENITFEITQFLEGFSSQIQLSHEKQSVVGKANHHSKATSKISWERDSRFLYSKQYVNVVSEHLLENPLAVPKISVLLEHREDVWDIVAALKGMYEEVDSIPTSDHTLDIVPKGVSKLRGLMYLSERLGIKKEQIVMVGAGIDDIDAIRCCGLGVAMGEAPREVKAHADWITRSQDQKGLPYFITELFRKQHPIPFLKKMNIIKS
ncbi:HAD-IIB family hydrolase [Rossellomorea aquimaris]|uniref:HAD-IIB family hydrolase n=1 Tax=Rossellomorea aquimaris TaxID=189382 RepID=UPI001CD70FAF|nr:HAD-IIB family hydrolase [Rossellomorea aquimaris]MCA1056491.1 HAD-IIB family hydrolase [Rossellomorea aquimaris]